MGRIIKPGSVLAMENVIAGVGIELSHFDLNLHVQVSENGWLFTRVTYTKKIRVAPHKTGWLMVQELDTAGLVEREFPMDVSTIKGKMEISAWIVGQFMFTDNDKIRRVKEQADGDH